MWVDDLLQTLTHPQVMPQIVNWVRQSQQPPTDPYEALKERLDAIQVAVTAPSAGAPPPPAFLATAPAGVDVAAVRDQVVAQAATLKEALRFAREDGIQHPEAQQRVADVQRWAREQVPVLERYELAPERLAQLPPAQRQLWESLLPQIRRLRQSALNDMGTTEGVTETAALAGSLATALQTASVVASAPPPPKGASEGAYSQYAPDMERDTGCIPCANAHLHAVGSVLGKAAEVAEAGSFTDPQVQERLSFAQEELAALFAYDWTPEKIAASPPADKAILDVYAPKLQTLQQQLRQARDAATVRRLADRSRALLAEYDAAVAARSAPAAEFAQWVTATEPAAPAGSPRVGGARVWLQHRPTDAEAAALTRPPNTAEAFDHLQAALEARGVRVRFRAMPATDTHFLEGLYNSANNVITLAPAALSKDSYAVQTEIHEAAHQLLHSPACLPHPPEDHSVQEQQAEDVTVLTMIRAGLPIETREGDVIEPVGHEIDWSALTAEVGAPTATNLRWASDWILAALQGQPLPTIQETCPVPQA